MRSISNSGEAADSITHRPQSKDEQEGPRGGLHGSFPAIDAVREIAHLDSTLATAYRIRFTIKLLQRIRMSETLLETKAAFARRHGVSRAALTKWGKRGWLVIVDGLVDVEVSNYLLKRYSSSYMREIRQKAGRQRKGNKTG